MQGLVSLALSTDTCCPTLVKVTYPVNGSNGLGKIATQLLMNSGTYVLRIRVDIDASGVLIASTSHLLVLLDCSCECNNTCCNRSHQLLTLTPLILQLTLHSPRKCSSVSHVNRFATVKTRV